MFAVQDACRPEPRSPVHEGPYFTAVPEVLWVARTSQGALLTSEVGLREAVA